MKCGVCSKHFTIIFSFFVDWFTWLIVVMTLFRLAASIAAEEERRFAKIASTSQTMISSDEDNEDEEMILVSFICWEFSCFSCFH